jgi:hypothetical protein
MCSELINVFVRNVVGVNGKQAFCLWPWPRTLPWRLDASHPGTRLTILGLKHATLGMYWALYESI